MHVQISKKIISRNKNIPCIQYRMMFAKNGTFTLDNLISTFKDTLICLCQKYVVST